MTSCSDYSSPVIRTQIQLTEEQSRRLREIARRDGISLAEAIRRCVDRALAETSSDPGALYARAARLVGAFRDRDGATDVAEEHDRYLDEGS
jgi:hypothetical protein